MWQIKNAPRIRKLGISCVLLTGALIMGVLSVDLPTE